MAPQWNLLENGSLKKKKFHSLQNRYYCTSQSGTKRVPKRGPSCGNENGTTVEPFRLHFFLSVFVRPPETK